MGDPYPPVAFAFTVGLADAPAEPPCGFAEVGGLEAGVDTDKIAEGGEGAFVHRLPRTPARPNLVLKRGSVRSDAALVAWMRDTLEAGFAAPVRPRDLIVTLADETGRAVARWAVGGAWPVRWSVSGVDAAAGLVAVEAVEFAYADIERVP